MQIASAEQPSPISFSTLKKLGKGCFRIVWFGNIVRSNALENIVVVFSPCSVTASTGKDRCDLSRRISAVLPVAYLRKFRIGDIWEEGKWTGRRDTQAKEVFSLKISEASVTVMPVGVPLNSDRFRPQYLLPFSDFVGHREHTGAHCVRVTSENGSTLIIPCMELIRFYFGASGSFLKRLFSGAFALDRLYSNARLNNKNGIANIDLAADLSGMAATTVARIAFCNQARSAARWVVNSSVATAANRLNYYPKTTFPFLGETDLTVYGRWIIEGKSPIFLVEQLSRCTHPFPFDALYYSTFHALALQVKAAGEIAPAGNPADQKKPSGSKQEMELTETPVSSKMLEVGLLAEEDGGLCFPDLRNKKVQRVGKKNHIASTRDAGDAMQELGTGYKTSSGPARGSELVTDLKESTADELPPPDVTTVIEKVVSANNRTNPGNMNWLPISGQGSSVGNNRNTFVRGDRIFGEENDHHLQNIWAGLLELKVGGIVAPVLLLVRDNLQQDSDDHVVLIHLEPSRLSQDINQYCRLFAAHKQSTAYAENVLAVIHSEMALNLYAMLRKFSGILSALVRRHARASRTTTEE